MRPRILLAFVFLQPLSLHAAFVVVDTFTGSYLDRVIASGGNSPTVPSFAVGGDEKLGAATCRGVWGLYNKQGLVKSTRCPEAGILVISGICQSPRAD